MIQTENNTFILNTENTTYAFRLLPSGHLEHMYYGRRITIKNPDAITEKHAFVPANSTQYSSEYDHFCLEDLCLEFSSYGKGDIWEPSIELVNSDGVSTCDFIFEKAEVLDTKDEYKTLPGSYDEKGKYEHLCITLMERFYKHKVELHYYVYTECDVICRSTKFINGSKDGLLLKRLMSCQLDFADKDFTFTSFHGAWAREMQRSDALLTQGKFVNSTIAGVSSNRANPFVMLSRPGASEDYGEVYAMNLIYSSNHYEAAEVTAYGKTRFVNGINPATFSYFVEGGQEFEAPEAVMTYSHQGFNAMSQNMHHFVKEHIVRGEWKNKVRPVLLNSWEAAYFDINERKLVNLAKAGKDAGIELFVMDDGWFGQRNDDHRSLGDWIVNKKKLPNGIEGLCKKINSLGLDFGIWVEPEMVNVDSDLYRAHPDWAVEIPGHEHTEGRNQRILDLTQPIVQDYLIEAMSAVFGSANIAYVKWDMNRIFSDYYSQKLDAKNQGEVAHRYVCGLYRCMKELVKRFPHILFEGCSAGGNRFDLGILSFFPQIWASDDTDAVCRAEIQNGYSYGYPMNTVSAHVSACPNHQTLRTTPLETRFNVAAFGICGYECNLAEMKKDDLAAVKAQIELYKKWREVLQTGNFYRSRNFLTSNMTEWICVSKDKTKAVGMMMQKLVRPNTRYECFKAHGLNPDAEYHFYSYGMKFSIKNFGSLVNTVSPVHIKQDSLLEDIIARFVKIDGETEDCLVNGDTLMYSGVKLKQAFAGTGLNAETRYYPDFGSRLYFMES
ncbi:alpha-galactosidase [Treponema sp.]|uniref:alpha-galactosidase n=1 Tax=Treponema sp. TaxID=166 RepID=UPI0025E02D23|nr:alpha-galactosidase [Treponema sp.]MCR5217072.1 alpha-galactosidase [Treponema sp.]